MKVLVKIPLRLCCTLMERCEKLGSEYQRFKKGTVLQKELAFACEHKEAREFARWADFFVPGAGGQIQIVSRRHQTQLRKYLKIHLSLF
jgi:hypothetical protein